MADFKKFMFDNFVVDNKTNKSKKADEVPVEKVEAEVVSKPVEQNKTEEFETFDVDYEEVKEEKVTYTQEELDSRVKIARDEGYEEGFKASQSSLEVNRIELLANVDANLLNIFEKIDAKVFEMEKDCAELLKAVLRKIVPGVLEEKAKEIVESFIKDNFVNIKKEAKLSFYANPEVIPYVQEVVAGLARASDFEGKISMHKDAGLGISDCRIEWEKGGVERNAEEILNKVDDVLNYGS